MSEQFELAKVPDAKWGIDELGVYVQGLVRTAAADIWKIGNALQIVRTKCKHGEWEKWCKTHVPNLSKPTINRFMTVGRELTLEQVVGKKTTDVYRELKMIAGPTTKQRPRPNTATVDPTPPEEVAAQDIDAPRAAAPVIAPVTAPVVVPNAAEFAAKLADDAAAMKAYHRFGGWLRRVEMVKVVPQPSELLALILAHWQR